MRHFGIDELDPLVPPVMCAVMEQGLQPARAELAHEAAGGARIVAGIGQQPGHQPVGLAFGQADIAPLAAMLVQPGPVTQDIMRQLMGDGGGQLVLGIIESYEIAPEHHACAVGSSLLAAIEQFETAAAGGRALDISCVRPRRIAPAQRDHAIASQVAFEQVVPSLEPLPIASLGRLERFGRMRADGKDLVIGIEPCLLGGRSCSHRLHGQVSADPGGAAHFLRIAVTGHILQQQPDRRP